VANPSTRAREEQLGEGGREGGEDGGREGGWEGGREGGTEERLGSPRPCPPLLEALG